MDCRWRRTDVSQPFPVSRVATIVFLGALLCSCASQGVGNIGEKDSETRRIEQSAERSWPEWARAHLGVGSGSLVEARGRLQGNDWGVADSFEWDLTFRGDRPDGGGAVLRAVRRACEFAPGQALTSHRVTAHFATRGTQALVPTVLDTDCSDDFDRLAPWLSYLEKRALPREVRGSTVSVQPDDVGEDDLVTLFVSSPNGVPAVAQRIARHYCSAPDGSDLALSIRSSDHPSAIEVPSLSSDPVSTPSCRPRR
jgi:hypothetical protein